MSTLASTDPALHEFAQLVGADDPVAVQGHGPRWHLHPLPQGGYPFPVALTSRLLAVLECHPLRPHGVPARSALIGADVCLLSRATR